METPFDTLVDRLRQSVLNRCPQDAESSELFKVVYSFIKISRVLYINMVNASEHKQQKPKIFTQNVHYEGEDLLIQCKLSYFQFIDHVNRTGRVLKGKGFPVPLYARIYFFRNKMVEHWDDYLQFILAGDGLLQHKDKIAIPYASYGNIRGGDAVRTSLQQQITNEFAKSGVTLPSLEGKWWGEYADIVFANLEQIDSKLRSYDKKRNIGIPEPLVMLLFKYSFPTPISDMEAYCKTLGAWLEDLPLITT